MLIGLGGGITFPFGTLGAAKQAEALINSVRPMTAAITGFIPAGKGESDLVDLNIAIGGQEVNATTVENQISGGDPSVVKSYIQSFGIDNAFNAVQGSTAVRDIPLVSSSGAIVNSNSTPTTTTTTTSTNFTDMVNGSTGVSLFGLSPLMLGVLAVGAYFVFKD